MFTLVPFIFMLCSFTSHGHSQFTLLWWTLSSSMKSVNRQQIKTNCQFYSIQTGIYFHHLKFDKYGKWTCTGEGISVSWHGLCTCTLYRHNNLTDFTLHKNTYLSLRCKLDVSQQSQGINKLNIITRLAQSRTCRRSGSSKWFTNVIYTSLTCLRQYNF